MLLLDLVALETTRLVGITVGLTLTSPVSDSINIKSGSDTVSGPQTTDLSPVENIWSNTYEKYKDPAPNAIAK